MFKNFKEKHAGKFGLASSDAKPSESDRGQDLTTILDRSQRADLTILIAQLMESMRKGIDLNFQVRVPPPKKSGAPNAPNAPPEGEKDNGGDNENGEQDGDNKDNAKVDEKGEGDEEKDSGLGNEKDTKSEDRREDGLNGNDKSPADQQSNTQDAIPGSGDKDEDAHFVVKDKGGVQSTLSHFDDWRDTVFIRIGEVLNREDDEHEQKREIAKPQDTQSEDTFVQLDQKTLDKLREAYPPVETPLVQLPQAKKLLILHSLLLLMLSLEHYNALSRVLMLNVVSSLGLDLKILDEDEVKVARVLLDAAMQMPSNAEEPYQGKKDDPTRKWKVGLASVAGAVLIGVTGGLAAPLVAAGLGTVLGGLGLGATAAAGYIGVLASSGVIVGGLFGAYGGRMTGQMMDKYAREVDDFAFIPLRGVQGRYQDEKDAARQDHRLRVTIGITGWVTDEQNFVAPWRVIGPDSEVFALRWELEALMNLGHSIRAMVTSAAWGFAGEQILEETILAGIMSAVALPLGILKVSRIAENPYSVAKARADKAGQVLADALINKVQGERAVNLFGYSLGSRVIYSCLQTLAKRRAYGLVESAILMGSPTPSNGEHWRTLRSVVAGRLVNVYSKHDAVLKVLDRSSSLGAGVAGLQPVEGLPGVENLDVSDLVNGHLRYQYLVGRILQLIGLVSVDEHELSRGEAALAAQDNRQEQERKQNERRAGVEDKESARRTIETGEGLSEEQERLQRQVQQRTDEQLIPRKFEQMDLAGPPGSRTNGKGNLFE